MNIVKINYEKKMNEIIEKIQNKKERLLLHSCCAPCSSAVIEYLHDYFNITIFFYNPNITDNQEYHMRKEEQKRYLQGKFPDIALVDCEYNPRKDFFDAVKGYEKCKEGGERCKICYEKRLEETAKYAKENDFLYFGTVLTISPMKNEQWINSLGDELQERYKVNFLFSDFKKKGRFQRSIQISKIDNLYRQDYCGCIFSKESLREREEDKGNEV